MNPMKLEPNKYGECFCPCCGGKLAFLRYMPADEQEGHYECGACDLAFQKISQSDFYQAHTRKVTKSMEPMKIEKDQSGHECCPRCKSKLVHIGYSPVHIYKGRLNMEDSEEHYECGCCNLSFRRIVSTDFYQCYDRNIEANTEPQRISSSGGSAQCPRCHEEMRYIEYQPVMIIDGKVNMDKVEPHYECDHCHLTYRRLVHTDFYQANKKDHHKMK